jgi:hypothetical protein
MLLCAAEYLHNAYPATRFKSRGFNFTRKIGRSGGSGARYRQNFLDSCTAEISTGKFARRMRARTIAVI